MGRRGSHELQLIVPPEVTTPRLVRSAFRDAFPALSALDDALLCLSEVVTNSVLHARTAVLVSACELGGVVRVEVRDGSAALPQRRPVDRSATSGRGVHLLEVLASRWGVEREPGGKVVWFEFAAGG